MDRNYEQKVHTYTPSVFLPPSWSVAAGCLEHIELFDRVADSGIEGPKMQQVRGICANCPVQAECLALAVDWETAGGAAAYGIWGGLTPRERKQITRRKRGA